MCQHCYESEGSPVPGADARAIASRLNEVDPFGGCHIVVEDWNMEDEHIQYCIDNSSTTDTEREIMRDLLKLPLDQRYAAIAYAQEFVIANPCKHENAVDGVSGGWECPDCGACDFL